MRLAIPLFVVAAAFAAAAPVAAAAPAVAGSPAAHSSSRSVFATGRWRDSPGHPTLSPSTIPRDHGLTCPWDYEALNWLLDINPYQQCKFRDIYATYRHRHQTANARAAALERELRQELARRSPRRERVATLLDALGSARTEAGGAYTLMQTKCYNTLGALQKSDLSDPTFGFWPVPWDWDGDGDGDADGAPFAYDGGRPSWGRPRPPHPSPRPPRHPVAPPRTPRHPHPHQPYLDASAALPAWPRLPSISSLPQDGRIGVGVDVVMDPHPVAPPHPVVVDPQPVYTPPPAPPPVRAWQPVSPVSQRVYQRR